jgi:hypothetical protein
MSLRLIALDKVHALQPFRGLAQSVPVLRRACAPEW